MHYSILFSTYNINITLSSFAIISLDLWQWYGRCSCCTLHRQDVSPDRLFIYIHDLQRDTLFVCRPSQTLCELQGVRLAVLELQKKTCGWGFFCWGGKNIKEMVIEIWQTWGSLLGKFGFFEPSVDLLSVGLLARGLDKRRNKTQNTTCFFFAMVSPSSWPIGAIPINSQISSKCAVAYPARLNPYYPYAVNRAVQWEGGLYFQVFCGGPGVHDGGLEDITVPYTLSHGDTYPEKREDGFFWLNAEDWVEGGICGGQGNGTAVGIQVRLLFFHLKNLTEQRSPTHLDLSIFNFESMVSPDVQVMEEIWPTTWSVQNPLNKW